MDRRIPYPNPNTYTIYSKSGCHYCTKAKDLVQKKSPVVIDCDEYLIENKDLFIHTMCTRIGKEHKTFPIVFYKGEYLGGFTDTKEHYETSEFKPKSEFLSFSTEF
jgi:glutaredoxin